jgi:hypothetical protein
MDHETWALGFEARHRFGIPLDHNAQEAHMAPSLIKLPAKAGKLEYSEEDQEAVLRLLSEAEAGQGVQVDEPQDTENKARVRARVMAGLVEDGVAEGWKLRVHTVKVTTGQGATKRDRWVPALSLKRDRTAPAQADAAPTEEG